MKFVPLEELLQYVIIATGISFVLAGSKIGHPIRFAWCWMMDRLHLSYFWSIMTCPPCNSWWTGFLLSVAGGYAFTEALQVAFATCGVVAAIQGISDNTGFGAEEDYNQLIPRRDEAKEKEHGIS